MSQLTVRGVGDKLHQRLKQEANKQGISLNRYLLKIIREAAGVIPPDRRKKEYHDLDHLAGTWSEEEYEEFQQNLARQRQIDDELWK